MSAAYRLRLIVVGLLVAFVAFLAAVQLEHDGPLKARSGLPASVTASPRGGGIDRLTPVSVRFRSAPRDQDAAALMQIAPATPGSYVWQDNRTLLFQPDFPGFLRGRQYDVSVRSDQPGESFDPFSFQFTTAGALTVDSVIPAPDDVEVPANAQVLVQFSRSVAPLTTLQEQPAAPVLFIDPPLQGKGEWLNTSLYRFTPDPGAVAPFTRYTMRIPARLTDEPDGALPQDYAWSYQTFSPTLVNVTPADKTKFAAPDQKVTLKFNQPMDRASVEAGVHLTQAGVIGDVPGAFAWSDDGASVVFTAGGRLAPLANYQLMVDKGLRGVTGGETRVAWSSVFDTIGLPSVKSTTPKDGDQKAPRYGATISFTNPMSEDSFDGRVSVKGTPVKDTALSLSGDGLQLYVSASFDTSTPYSVALADGIVDRYGQPLAPFGFAFVTGARPPSVTLAVPNQVATYSASQEPVLFYHATNSDTVTFTLYPLTAKEMLAIEQRNRIDPDPTHRFQPSQAALSNWTEDASGAKDEVVLKSTSLSRKGGPLPKGEYLLRYSGDYVTPGLAFSVVDTALITKVSFDELLVWALDLDTGQPLTGVSLNANGGSLAKGASSSVSTDAQGLASFPLQVSPSPQPYGPQLDHSFVVTLDGGGRKGVASTSWQQGAYPYSQGLPVEFYPRQYVANVYTERPIYKPGEEVPVKLVLRLDDDAQYSIPSDAPGVFVTITDPQRKQLLHLPVQLNEFGTFASSFNLSSDAVTGEYGVTVAWQASSVYDYPLATTSFAVAAFRVPEFQVTASPAQPSYVAGDDIETQVEATYYFGGALEGAPVTWSATSNAYTPHFKDYQRYSFNDADPSRTSVYKAPLRSAGNAVIGATGDATISVPAVISGNEGAQQYQIGAQVSDQSAQAVAATTNVVVYPAAVLAGIRPEKYVAKAGQESRIDLVSVDTDGKPLPHRDVTVRVYNRTWVTTKEQTAEGARRYTSQPQDTLVATLSTTTGDNGTGSLAYTPDSSGSLRLVAEISDDQGRTERSSTYLYVNGGAYASWQVTNDDTLKLIADRDEYNVGDTAQVLVPAPFDGAIGLVTVERGKVITRQVQQFPTNSERLDIPIVEHDVPNVFVSTILYRPPTNQDPVPRYKVGYVELPVSTQTRVLNVSVAPDRDQAQPGQAVHYAVKVTDSTGHGVRAEVSVAVVDKALLSLADERGLNGLKAFWFQRGLGVVTSSSLAVSVNRANDVISEPPAGQGGKGGDGTDDERIRQDFRNTAFWQAQLATDDDGNAGFDVTMPDNVTTWHTQVRAVSGDTKVGEGSNELVSTQPLLVRPALPRFLRVGDTPTLRALVRNATRAPVDVKVTMDATGIDLGAPKDQTLRVQPNSSSLVEWPASVSKEGSASFTITASNAAAGPGSGDAVKLSLPVYQAITPETTATGGVVTNQTASESVYLPPYLNTSQGSLSVTVQASLVKALPPQLSNFGPEPYETSERVASRIVATLAVAHADPTAGVGTAGLASDVAELIGFQRSDGGFGWCSSSCDSDAQITAWALVALGDWQRAGNKVDANVLNRARNFVNVYVNRFDDVKQPADPNVTAFMLYAEANSSSAGPGPYLANLRALFQQYRGQLTSSGRAYLLLGMGMSGLSKKDPEVRTLLDDAAAAVVPGATGNHWEDDPAKAARLLQTGPRTTALMLDALVGIDPGHPLIDETVRWLGVAITANRGLGSTLERAQAVRSLANYAALTGELGADFSYSVKLDQDQVESGRLRSGQTPVEEQLSLNTLDLGKSHLISLARDFAAKGRLYYTLALRYTTPATSIEALNRGMAVSHQYTQVDGSDRPFKLGDVARITVTVMTPAERDYVTLEDDLPAGLEAIDPQLKTTDPKLKSQLEADRSAAGRPANLDYYAPWLSWYYNPWQQVDLRDDHVTVKAQRLSKGVYQFIYYARATTPGSFFVPPAHVEESYFPEVFGRSDSSRFIIAPN